MSNWSWSSWYWLAWITVVFGTFLPVELWALFSGHPEHTLSEHVWAAEKFIPGSNAAWTVSHWVIGIGCILLLGWLIVHFVWGILR